MREVFVGIDLGGTNIKFGCFDSEINLISKASTPTTARMGPEAVVEKERQKLYTLTNKMERLKQQIRNP